MSDYDHLILPLQSDQKINTAFVKANLTLLKKYEHDFKKTKTKQEKQNLLEKLWYTEYSVELLRDRDSYKSLKFLNNNEMTLFLIKWG